MLTPNTKVSIKDLDGSTYKEYRLDLKPKPNFTPSWQENDAWIKNNWEKVWWFQIFCLPLQSNWEREIGFRKFPLLGMLL